MNRFNQLSKMEKEFQIEELKRYGKRVLKSGIGMYCVNVIFNAVGIKGMELTLYPALATLLTLILMFVLPCVFIHALYKIVKTLVSPAKMI